MKTASRRVPTGEREPASGFVRSSRSGADTQPGDDPLLLGSPRLIAQRSSIQAMFGNTAETRSTENRVVPATDPIQRRFTYDGTPYERGVDVRDLCRRTALAPFAQGIRALAGNRDVDLTFESEGDLITAAEREQSTSGGKPLGGGGVLTGLLVSDLEAFKGKVFGMTCAHVLPVGTVGSMTALTSGREGGAKLDWSLLEMANDAVTPQHGITSRAPWKDKTKAERPPLPSQTVGFLTGRPQPVTLGQVVHLLGPHGRRTFTVFEQNVGGGYWGLIPLDVEGQLMAATNHAQWNEIVDNVTASGTSGSCYFIDVGQGIFEPIGLHVGKTKGEAEREYDGQAIAEKFPLIKQERAKSPADVRMPKIIRMAAATEVMDEINRSEWAKSQRTKHGLGEQDDLKLRFATVEDQLQPTGK